MYKFDAKILQNYAGQLYRSAASISWKYAIGGYILGSVFGSTLGGLTNSIPTKVVSVLLNGFIGMVIGYYIGKEKANNEKAKANMILLQLQIEENTRNMGKENIDDNL